MSERRDDNKRDKLILPLAAVTMLGWIASLADAVVVNQVTALTLTTPVMLALAGYVFGASIVRVVARGKDEPND